MDEADRILNMDFEEEVLLIQRFVFLHFALFSWSTRVYIMYHVHFIYGFVRKTCKVKFSEFPCWKLTTTENSFKVHKKIYQRKYKFSNVRKFELFWNFHRSIKFWRSCLKKDVRICFPLLWQKKLRNFSELLYMILSKLRSPRSKSR